MTQFHSTSIKTACRGFLLAVLLLVGFTPRLAADPSLPEPQNPPMLVNDFAGVLTSSQINALEHKLVSFDDSTSNQIAVVTVASLDGYDASEYAVQLHRKWKVGTDDKDNGILILVKPKNDEGYGDVFISVGYGLEGAIPDITAKRIINECMIPKFKENDYYGAIESACDRLMALASGEYSDPDEESPFVGIIGALIMLVIFVFVIVILTKSGSGGKGGSNGSGGRGHDSTGPIFRSGGIGGGSIGGSFGGGFGGFGGGMAGGGGAGGRW